MAVRHGSLPLFLVASVKIQVKIANTFDLKLADMPQQEAATAWGGT